MNRHPTVGQLIEYRRGELRPGDFLEVQRHLLSCPACAESYGAVRPLGGDYATLLGALLPGADEGPFHLTMRDASDYVRGEADDVSAEIAETHLEACPECARMVSALRQAGGEPAHVIQTLPAVPAAYKLPGHARLLASVARHRLTVAASVLVVAGLAIAFILQRGVRERPDVSNNPASVSSSTQVTPTPPEQQQHKEVGPDSNTAHAPQPSPARESAAPPSRPLLALLDGKRLVTLTREGELSGLPVMPLSLSRSVSAALASGRVETPRDLADLKGSRSVLLGEGDDGIPFRLLSPVGVVIADRQPLLKWSPLPGASSYTVTVTDANYDEVAVSQPLTGFEWRVPVALAPGSTYTWQVSARRGEDEVRSPTMPAPAAKFKLLSSASEREVRRARRLYAGSHLLLGVIYARAGLLDEAAREFQALSEINPGSALPRRLLRSVR